MVEVIRVLRKIHQKDQTQGEMRIFPMLIIYSFVNYVFSDEASTINHQIGEYIAYNLAAGDSESNSYYSGAHPHSIHDLSRRTSVSVNSYIVEKSIIY